MAFFQLISKYFKEDGELLIQVNPEFKKSYTTIVVDDKKEERFELGELKTFL